MWQSQVSAIPGKSQSSSLVELESSGRAGLETSAFWRCHEEVYRRIKAGDRVSGQSPAREPF
jgi:hypothetical protein